MYYILIKKSERGIGSLYQYYIETVEDVDRIYAAETIDELKEKLEYVHEIYDHSSITVVKGMKMDCDINITEEPVQSAPPVDEGEAE